MADFNITKLKQAWDKNDAAMLAGLFADKYQLIEIDEATPPNNPRKRTKLDFLDTAQRAMSKGVRMEVYNLVNDRNMAAYSFTCHMPGGTVMVGNSILEIKDGQIVKETIVQAKEK